MANNTSAVENAGAYPDWIELYNLTPQDVDLADWSLTDTYASPRKFIFQPGTIIPSNGFLLVFCDDRTSSPGIHTGFSLNDKGEAIILFDSPVRGGAIKDVVEFGIQLRDFSAGRVPDVTSQFTLTIPTPLAANVPAPLGNSATLKINEWSALNGSSATNTKPDWFELYNPDPLPVALTGLVFTDRLTVPATNPPLAVSFIEGGGFIQFFADDKTTPGDQVNFKLSSTSGDHILLYQPDRITLIDSVSFGPQTLNVSQGRLPDGSTNIVFFRTNQPTPQASNFLPIPEIVIHEVLSHSEPPLEGAIELLNISSVSVDISGWWLSNSKDEPRKFRIPGGTVLPPGGFVVFYEGVGASVGFNTSGTGLAPDFTFNSAHGGEVYLFTADASGELTGYRRKVDFRAAENGVSFGRYTTSTGEADFVPMSYRTFGVDNPSTVEQFRAGTGLANAYPKVGPVVITEIMYHPPDIPGMTDLIDNARDEYIELENVSAGPVPLYDPAFPTNTWRIRGEVDFDFPTSQTLGAGQSLIVANFDPADAIQFDAFRSKYKVPFNIPIYGPYRGKLSNKSGEIELQKPDTPQLPPHPDAGFVPHITVERVKYSDSAPWPANADGTGYSVHRCRPTEYGNDPINWMGAPPTPGRPEIGIGITIQSFQRSSYLLTICFDACTGRSYSLLSADSPAPSHWAKVRDITASATGRQCVDLPIMPSASGGFFRVVTPAQP